MPQQLKYLFDASTDFDKDEYLDCEETWYEEIAYKIAGLGQPGVDFLLSRVTAADEARLRAIIGAIAWPKEKSERIYEMLRFYLNDPMPLVVSEVIDTARHLNYTEFLDEVLARQNHASPYVVGSVLRYLAQHYSLLAKPLLLEALEAQDPIIIQNGIDELDILEASEALPKIRQLQSHVDENVRRAAQSAVASLQELSEQD